MMGRSLRKSLTTNGNAKPLRPNERFVNAFFDLELFDEIKAYAAKHKLAVSVAVTELATIGLETIKDEKTNAIILRVRDNKRALMLSTAFDFNQDCFKCGKRGLIRIHGHVQCRHCGCVVEPCCE
jgi:hypothetical protein